MPTRLASSRHTQRMCLQDHAPCNNEHEVKRLFKQLAPIVDGSLANCFGGRLFSPEGGAMAIRRENVSDHSVCFWRADRELTISRFGGKYDYRSGNIQTSIKYVGFQDPINLIPAGQFCAFPYLGGGTWKVARGIAGCSCRVGISSAHKSITNAYRCDGRTGEVRAADV